MNFEFEEYQRIGPLMVSVDLVIVTCAEGGLKVLVVERDVEPFCGEYALPSWFMQEERTLDDTAVFLRNAVGLYDAPVEQFGIFSHPERDPRARVISVGFMTLCEAGKVEHLVPLDVRYKLADANLDDHGGPELSLWDRSIELAFDHHDLIASALHNVRRVLDASLWPFKLLPDWFTLSELQQVHEAFRGRRLNTPIFRKSILARVFEDGTCLQPTGRQKPGRGRPARLYKRVPADDSEVALKRRAGRRAPEIEEEYTDAP